jgi:hypothetical protein
MPGRPSFTTSADGMTFTRRASTSEKSFVVPSGSSAVVIAWGWQDTPIGGSQISGNSRASSIMGASIRRSIRALERRRAWTGHTGRHRRTLRIPPTPGSSSSTTAPSTAAPSARAPKTMSVPFVQPNEEASSGLACGSSKISRSQLDDLHANKKTNDYKK